MSQGAIQFGKKATRGENNLHDANPECWCGPQKCVCGGFRHALVSEEGRRFCSLCGSRAS